MEGFFFSDLIIITSKYMLLLRLNDRIETKVLKTFKKLNSTEAVFIVPLKSLKFFKGRQVEIWILRL